MLRFIIILIVITLLRVFAFYFLDLKYSPKIDLNFNFAFELKNNVRQIYGRTLSPDQADLLYGIVFGESKKTSYQKKYVTTGVLHVVAASGMNVSMLTAFFMSTLIIFFKRQHALVICSLFILFYAVLASFQPSIVRASIMAMFAIGAGILGRQNTSLIALLFTAFVMIFWDPVVLTSVSFILSFAATLGIILLEPLFKKGIFKKDIFEDFRTSISAQLATTPILLFFFGIFSPISLIVNFLVLWTIPPLMVLGGAGAFLALFSSFLALPLIYLCMPLLYYFNLMVDIFAKASSFELKDTPWTIVLGYYSILFAVILFQYRKR